MTSILIRLVINFRRHHGQLALHNTIRCAGHAKWQNVSKTKQANDLPKDQTISRYVIQVRRAIVSNNMQTDPKLNSRLAEVLAEASEFNVPKATLDLAISSAQNIQVKPGSTEVQETLAVSHKVFKRINTEYHGVAPSEFEDDQVWIRIYQLPRLRLCRQIVKVKLVMTVASAFLCLEKLVAFLNQPNLNLMGLASLSATSLVGLILAGNFCRKLICRIYISDDSEYIRFTRLSFFANRIDMIVPKKSLEHLSELNSSWRSHFLKLRVLKPENVDLSYDQVEFYDQIFTLILRYGGVRDHDLFRQAFGPILDRKA